MQSQTITGRHAACLTIHIFSLQSPKTHSWAMPHQLVLHLCCKQQPFAQGSLEPLHAQVSARPPEGWGWVFIATQGALCLTAYIPRDLASTARCFLMGKSFRREELVGAGQRGRLEGLTSWWHEHSDVMPWLHSVFLR